MFITTLGEVARDATTQILAASAVSIASASLTTLKRRTQPAIFVEDEDIDAQAAEYFAERQYYTDLRTGAAYGAQVGY